MQAMLVWNESHRCWLLPYMKDEKHEVVTDQKMIPSILSFNLCLICGEVWRKAKSLQLHVLPENIHLGQLCFAVSAEVAEPTHIVRRRAARARTPRRCSRIVMSYLLSNMPLLTAQTGCQQNRDQAFARYVIVEQDKHYGPAGRILSERIWNPSVTLIRRKALRKECR